MEARAGEDGPRKGSADRPPGLVEVLVSVAVAIAIAVALLAALAVAFDRGRPA